MQVGPRPPASAAAFVRTNVARALPGRGSKSPRNSATVTASGASCRYCQDG